MYAEHIHFLVTRTGWLVTKIYAHYTFEQSLFKKEFVTMNQFARQKAETSVEKSFYRLMNNANFGKDCWSNIDNFQFEPIYHEIGEITFIKKYANIFGYSQYKGFACVEAMKEEIEQNYNNKLLSLDPNDPTFEARKYSINIERAESVDALESMQIHKKKAIKNELFSILKVWQKIA